MPDRLADLKIRPIPTGERKHFCSLMAESIEFRGLGGRHHQKIDLISVSQAFLEKVILSELDEESVKLFRERRELPEIDPYVHYKLRETEIEPAKFNSRFGMNDLLNPWDASNNFHESASW